MATPFYWPRQQISGIDRDTEKSDKGIQMVFCLMDKATKVKNNNGGHRSDLHFSLLTFAKAKDNGCLVLESNQ